jgi:ribonuclease HII
MPLSKAAQQAKEARRRARVRAEEQRLEALYAEQEAAGENAFVIGVDEVGRGSVAGPLTVAAVYLPLNPRIAGLNDSKKLSAQRREEIDVRIRACAHALGIAHVPPEDIDRDGMADSLKRAMREALAACVTAYGKACANDCNETGGDKAGGDETGGGGADRNETGGNKADRDGAGGTQNRALGSSANPEPDLVLIDGIPLGIHSQERSIVKGDAKVACIAAASIVAKVARDALMREADADYPGYGLADNKGYASKEHIAAIRAMGTSAFHRVSFCQGFFQEQLPLNF